jgi:alkylation response protein AidB-like acyl-CoA dehydrogenase
MAQRRQIRVSRSLEGGGERPAMGYGEPEAGLGSLSMASETLAPRYGRLSIGTNSRSVSPE